MDLDKLYPIGTRKNALDTNSHALEAWLAALRSHTRSQLKKCPFYQNHLPNPVFFCWARSMLNDFTYFFTFYHLLSKSAPRLKVLFHRALTPSGQNGKTTNSGAARLPSSKCCLDCDPPKSTRPIVRSVSDRWMVAKSPKVA